MPDIAYLSPLCEVLDINVNELLSGEKLPSEEYLGKAEENMKHLMQLRQKLRFKEKMFTLGLLREQ